MPHATRTGDQATAIRAATRWLERIAENGDLSSEPPNNAFGSAIVPIVALVSDEFAGYSQIVAAARTAARRNAVELEAVVASAVEQGMTVRATADAAHTAGQGSISTAAAADALREFARAAGDAAVRAGHDLAAIDAALRELTEQLGRSEDPIGEMRRSTAGVAEFTQTLARLSRQAQVLGVNASIEAAHLAQGGVRFRIVADEVRNLASSTRDSRTDVARIAGELRASTDLVADSIEESHQAAAAAGSGVAGAGDALTRTGRNIADFEQLAATVADVAAVQQTALESVGASIVQLAGHADEVAGASREAAALDLDAPLDRAQTRVSRWKRRERPVSPLTADDPVAQWILALVQGADPAAAGAIDAVPDLAPLAAAVRAFLGRVAVEQRAVLSDVVQAAVAVSRNSYAWRSIREARAAIAGKVDTVRSSIADSAAAARSSAELAGRMRAVVGTIRTEYEGALVSLEGALGRIARISASVGEIDGFVASMSAAAARANVIMGLIETLSAETDLLSLNAAIEAAHAGELGLGFGIIAEEIRTLARSTNASTASVSDLVATISRISGGLQSAIDAAAASMRAVAASADGARGAIATLRTAFESALERADDVSTAAAEQDAALERVLDAVNRGQATSQAGGSIDTGRLELATLGYRAHAIAAGRPLGTVIERVRELAESLCVRLEDAIGGALRRAKASPATLLDLSYTPIEGRAIGMLARLFDVSRVAATGFAPPKFRTPWDALIDEPMIDVLTCGWDEATAAAISPVAMFVSDLNGFFYAYPRQKIGAWTNDPAIDGLGNRIKRLLEDEYTLQVVRTGMGPDAAALGPRCSYDAFRSAGCELTSAANRPWGGYVYARDTSAVCNEVAMALYANGMRIGVLRICYDAALI